MRKCVQLWLVVLTAGSIWLWTNGGSAQDTDGEPGDVANLNVLCLDIGDNLDYCRETVNLWAESKEIEARVLVAPSTNETLSNITSLFSLNRATIDVVQIHMNWTPHLATELSPFLIVEEDIFKNHLPALFEAGEVRGLLVGLPYMISTGILYYRDDLLNEHDMTVPITWSELAATAQDIQAEEREGEEAKEFWGLALGGAPDESLTVQGLEWIAGAGGGRLVGDDGRASVSSDASVAALKQAASWIGTIVSPDALTQDAEQARRLFELGQAMFLREWAHVPVELDPLPPSEQEGEEDVSDHRRVGTARLPAGSGEDGAARPVLDGWLVSVSNYSSQPELARELALHLMSPEEQRVRALAGLPPTLTSLYSDRDVTTFRPELVHIARSIPRLVVRPTDITERRYPEVSAAFAQTVHDILAGETEPEAGLTRLNFDLNRMSRGGRQW